MSWTRYRDAPAPGTVLARSADVLESGHKSLMRGAFPVLLIRGRGSGEGGDGLAAFVNLCPHQYLPLDRMGARLLSVDGAVLRCSNHGAGFDAKTGEGVEGLGLGCALEAIPVEEADGEIRVAG